MTRKKIIILGANFAGLQAATQLSSRLYEVTVIDPSPYFEWTPNIHELLSGCKQLHTLQLSRFKVLSALNHRFAAHRATNFDPQWQTVDLETGETLQYDGLILAMGHETTDYGIKGVKEIASGFRKGAEIIQIRSRLESLLQQQNCVTVSIVGAGFTGIEALGELLRGYRHNPGLAIQIIEKGNQALPGYTQKISDDIRKICNEYPVHWHFNQTISSLTEGRIILSSGATLPSDITIWTTGTQPASLTLNVEALSPHRNGIPVKSTLQTHTHEAIFIAGDLADYTPGLTKQAYHALDMGKHAANNLARWLEGKTLLNFIPLNKPMALALGDLNTYLIYNQTVISSPALAATKEAIFQFYMTQLSRNLPVKLIAQSASERFASAFTEQLMPELNTQSLIHLLKHTEILQWGGRKDLETLAKTILSTALS
ncbi:MAG: FAD-dependent oxidoreductase [Pseudomonadales bacterium]|nr:FAD-dependent oxidoreductase [Pseudomonadales bacterium]